MRRPPGPALPATFVPCDLARSRGVLAGWLETGRLKRLALPESRALEVMVRGAVGDDGQMRLTVAIAGEVAVVCQRCLDVMSLPLNLESVVRLVFSEQEMQGVEPEVDALLVADDSAVADTLNLVEDEIILALPFAPVHAVGVCHPQAGVGRDNSPAAASNREADEDDNPFAVLRELKKN